MVYNIYNYTSNNEIWYKNGNKRTNIMNTMNIIKIVIVFLLYAIYNYKYIT